MNSRPMAQTKKMVLAAVFTALTAVGAFIRIPIPYVPIVLQGLFVFMAGALLGSKWGMLSQLVYVVLGLIGIPIFTQGGGPGYVLQPTFGFLMGFIPAAFVTGLVVEKRNQKNFQTMLIACLSGMVVIYLIGVPYLAVIYQMVLGKTNVVWLAFYTGCLICIPGDIIKALLAVFLSLRLYPHLTRR